MNVTTPLEKSWEASASPVEVKHIFTTQKNKKVPRPDKSHAEVLKKKKRELNSITCHSTASCMQMIWPFWKDWLAKEFENLHDCCASWGNHVHSQKSAIMHFQPKMLKPCIQRWKWETKLTEYTYLGFMNFVISTRVCCWEQTKQTRPYGICSQQMKLSELPSKVHRKLYDSMIAPVFDYGGQVRIVSLLLNRRPVKNKIYRFLWEWAGNTP